MTGEILFLAHRIPYPADRGDKIRSSALLGALAGLAPVHVGTFAETAADQAAEAQLAAVAASHCLILRDKPLWLAGAQALAAGKPVSLTAFDNPALHGWVAHTVATRPIGTIFVFSGQMGQYVPVEFAGRVVIDLCDVDSAKFDAYARERAGPRRWVDVREGRLLAAEEARLARRADATILISEAEADLFRSRMGGIKPTILAIGNGIDTARFDPATVARHPDLAAAPGPHCVFTGQMDYAPNVAAAVRMAHRLMPAIRAAHPGATFHVVGRAPTAAVRALDGVNGTRVWGEVADVRPFLSAADLVVAPLEIARGVQNKVLEAMAMARPVVLTGGAATGIPGTDGAHFTVGDSDAAFIERSLELLANPNAAQAMGQSARAFVSAEMSWPAALAPLANLVGPAKTLRDAA